MCQKLSGDWISATGGFKGRLNPLQVLPSPRDDEEEPEENRLYRDEGYGINDLAMHLKISISGLASIFRPCRICRKLL